MSTNITNNEELASVVRAGLLQVAVVCMLLGVQAFGQTASTVRVVNPPTPPPLSHLYWHFLTLQSHLDQEAVVREQQGKDGGWLRTHFQHELGFSDSEFDLVRESANKLDSKVKDVNSRMKALKQADPKLKYRATKDASTTASVSPRSDIEQEVENLRSSLGPERAAKLDSFLRNEFIKPVTTPHSGAPHQAQNSHTGGRP
jgi:hypothetical protein